MRVGVVFILNDNEQEIVTYQFKKFFKKNYVSKVCFVNIGQENKILKILNRIRESTKADISILDIKRKKCEKTAIKAGVRYLTNDGGLSYILYSKINGIQDFENMNLIMTSIENRSLLAPSLINKDKRRIFRNVFSFTEIKTILKLI